VSGEKAQYQTTTTVTTTLTSGGTVISGLTPTVTTTTDSPVELNGICYLAGTPAGAPPALPSPNPQHAGLDISPWPTVGPMPSGGCTAWPCSVSQTNVGGSINSLADVAQYYYVTDLRPSGVWVANIAEDNVNAVGGGPEDDRAKHQHMTTFTVALGVSGTLAYDAQYKKATIGDFADIRTGAKNWPLWPDPLQGHLG
jgi:type IV pilus assembly protein PilY1